MTRTTPRGGGAGTHRYAPVILPARCDIREAVRRALSRLVVTAAKISEVVG